MSCNVQDSLYHGERLALMSLRWENPGQVQVFCPLEAHGPNRTLCAHLLPEKTLPILKMKTAQERL